MRRVVVDSNMLQDERLRSYLARSPENYAILPEYAAIEAHKGDTLASIHRSMEILAAFPKQVIVLKGVLVACGMKGRQSGLLKRLVDAKQTEGFPKYCESLAAAKSGNRFIQAQLLEHGKHATAQMDRMLADAPHIPAAIDMITKQYTAEELRIVRNDEQFTADMAFKRMQHILMLTAIFFRDHPSVRRVPDAPEVANTLLFRVALCGYLLALRWIRVGGARDVKPERIRNDVVDLTFAAYGTFFDGLLTADKKVFSIYQEACALLRTTFRS